MQDIQVKIDLRIQILNSLQYRTEGFMLSKPVTFKEFH